MAMAESTWLTREQAAELIRERYNTSTGKAQAVVRDAFKSDEVRNTLADDEALSLLAFDGTAIPPAGLNRADFLDWLDRNPPGKRAAAIKKNRHVGMANIPDIVSQYLAAEGAPSMAGLVKHVRERDLLHIPRPILRDEYRKQRGNPRPGRPLDNRPK